MYLTDTHSPGDAWGGVKRNYRILKYLAMISTIVFFVHQNLAMFPRNTLLKASGFVTVDSGFPGTYLGREGLVDGSSYELADFQIFKLHETETILFSKMRLCWNVIFFLMMMAVLSLPADAPFSRLRTISLWAVCIMFVLTVLAHVMAWAEFAPADGGDWVGHYFFRDYFSVTLMIHFGISALSIIWMNYKIEPCGEDRVESSQHVVAKHSETN